MSFKQKLKHEIKTVGLVTLYFGCWLAVLLLIKQLVLAEYQIQFHAMTRALVGALILAKVVIVLEHVSLGAWVKQQPAWIDVLLRTVLYTSGVLAVLVLEKGLEGRHEYGGFIQSISTVWAHEDIYHLWTNAIVITGALLVYNIMSIVRSHLGDGQLIQIFKIPRPE
jgi:hypothetical protein